MSLHLTFTVDDAEVWSRNITHNLCRMAAEVGAYDVLWRPDENDIAKASDLTERLAHALHAFDSQPIDNFRRLEPENKWGTAEVFRAFLADTLRASRAWPNAKVDADR